MTPQAVRDAWPEIRAGLSLALRKGNYKFSSLRGVAVDKATGGTRLICVPTVRDRIVQRAILQILEPRSSAAGILNPASYGFIAKGNEDNKDKPRKTVRSAIEKAKEYRTNYPWVFKADISKFFDRIDRTHLKKKLSQLPRFTSSKNLLNLLMKAASCEVEEGNKRIVATLKSNDIRKGLGLRQGMPVSPFLSNIVLADFDKTILKNKFNMVRYADDLVVFCESKRACEDAQEIIVAELEKIGHELNAQKTDIFRPDEAVEFLGLDIVLRDKVYVSIVSEARFKRAKKKNSSYFMMCLG